MKRQDTLRVPTYPHFDGKLSQVQARILVRSPMAVASHAFFPLLKREKQNKKFRAGVLPAGGPKPNPPRPICCAARRDSVIFRYYRDQAAARYEDLLAAQGLSESVLAYRKIPSEDGRSKSNLHFAADAFHRISLFDRCDVYCLDIQKFFENLDHKLIFRGWADLFGFDRLPPDHFAVLKAATKYAAVDEKRALTELGLFGTRVLPNGTSVMGFLQRRRDLNTQLCDSATFKRKIVPLIERNKTGRGVAQGLPISDVLANLSLLVFDRELTAFSKSCGGFYCRYSDDILLVLPPSDRSVDEVKCLVERELLKCGSGLKLKDSKTVICKVESSGLGGKRIEVIGSPGRVGSIEYLGLSFDGVSTRLRQATLARLHRRIVYRVRGAVKALVEKHPSANLQTLTTLLSIQGIIRSFGRVEACVRSARTKPNKGYKGNFRSYAVKATRIFPGSEALILEQVSQQKKFIRKRAELELRKALKLPAP
jgi:hypothetical protein